MANLKIKNLQKGFEGFSIIKGIDLEVNDKEFVVFVGPSCCGKSTLLRLIAGLEEVSEGTIELDGRDITEVTPAKRDLAMVFQTYALYPHMTVGENMGFALKIAGRPKDEIKTRVAEAAKVLDLTDYLDRKPKALSGGQRQRVAMGRAIVRSPQVFCMDEPLSNLDAKLRVATRTQIASLQRRLAVTTLYVTHDQVEAMTMGDRVAVLKDGVLQQVDAPRAMYDRPANVFVAGFIGSPAMNLLTVQVDGEGTVQVGSLGVPMPRNGQGELTSGEVTIGVRPEDLRLVGTGEGVEVVVELVEELGSDAFLHGSVTGGSVGDMLVARVDPRNPPRKGEKVTLAPSPDQLHWFDASTGERVVD